MWPLFFNCIIIVFLNLKCYHKSLINNSFSKDRDTPFYLESELFVYFGIICCNLKFLKCYFISGSCHYVERVQIHKFLWSVFSRIWTEYEEIFCISPYSVRMRKNTEQGKLRIWTLFTQSVFTRFMFYIWKRENFQNFTEIAKSRLFACFHEAILIIFRNVGSGEPL